jgi:hypothetical protein
MMTAMESTVSAGAGQLAEELAGAALFLARRFAAGATMWCVCLPWPAHGRHVAVEFVHPVIVGKRALPAVHVEGPDPARALRLLARPGDVVLALGAADHAETADVLRRSEAWGLRRIWMGAGKRPATGYADQIVWNDRVDVDRAAYSGDLVVSYHLLWELTHVVFEHPGLLAAPPPAADAAARDQVCDPGCVTCSDGGDVAEVRAVHEGGSAEVVLAGRTETVDVTLVDPVEPGDLVLVHAGVAITSLPDLTGGTGP